MRVTFVLSAVPNLTGGNRVVLEYADQLTKMGQQVAVVFPAQAADRRHDEWLGLKSRLRMLRHSVVRRRQGRPIDWYDVLPEIEIVEVPSLQERHIPDSDAIVATFWTTAPWVSGYGKRMGKKFHLIQHYEVVHSPAERQSVDATWRLPLRKVVIARWLQELAERQFGARVYELVSNGVNHEHFYNGEKRYNSPRRIGMMCHPAKWKGVADGLRAVALARDRHPDLKLVLFGVQRPRFRLPDYAEFHHRPFGERLRRLYCSLDIFVSPSWSEGCGLPLMEAMACQCAVVATDSGAVTDFASPGDTILLSPPRQPELLAENIVSLLDDPAMLERISNAGCRRMQAFTWQASAAKLLAAFRRAMAEDDP